MSETNNKMDTIVICPNCNEFVLIKELNCCIFIHAIMIKTGEQIDPHSSNETCEKLIKEKKIYGCGKPFKIIVLENGTMKVVEYENN